MFEIINLSDEHDTNPYKHTKLRRRKIVDMSYIIFLLCVPILSNKCFIKSKSILWTFEREKGDLITHHLFCMPPCPIEECHTMTSAHVMTILKSVHQITTGQRLEGFF